MAEYTLTELQSRYGIELTEREIAILTAKKDLLNPLDRQRRFLLNVALSGMLCPGCNGLICQRSAILDPGLFFENKVIPDDGYQCPLCHAKLSYHVGFVAGTNWFSLQPGQMVTVPDEPPRSSGMSSRTHSP